MRRVLIVGAAFVAVGCGQTSPTVPSVVAQAAAGPAVGRLVGGIPNPPPIEPVLAQLNLVDNHLQSANHQLDLYLTPPNPITPPDPIVPPDPIFLRNALDFYLKANGVLSAISMPNPPPIAPQWTDALTAILGDANTTLVRLNPSCDACSPNPPPIFQDLIAQANQTKALATALMPTPPPI